MRREPDGTNSVIIATRQVCDCQPAAMLQQLQKALVALPGASVKTDKVTACSQAADHLIATGVANPTGSQRNLEVVVFRREPALIVLEYTFAQPQPSDDAEAALLTLCPPTD